jgi:hypothetical protein
VSTLAPSSNLLLPVGTGGCRGAAGREGRVFSRLGVVQSSRVSLKLQEEARAAGSQKHIGQEFPSVGFFFFFILSV